MKVHRKGLIFRNSQDNPWTAGGVKDAIKRAVIKVHLKRVEEGRSTSGVTESAIAELSTSLKAKDGGKKENWRYNLQAKQKLLYDEAKESVGRVFQYAMRHTYITDMIKSEVDSHVVAKLAGHKDTRMIDTVYSGVGSEHKFLLEQASKRKNARQ